MQRVAIIQMTSGADPQQNLTEIITRCEEAKQAGATLVVTPENALCFASKAQYHHYAEPLGNGTMQRSLSGLAQRLGLTLVIGSMPIRTKQGVMTSSIVFSPEGQQLAHYEKLHMFDVEVSDGHRHYRESETFIAGDNVVVTESEIGTLGLTICYDVRFPALYSELRRLGADVILVPAAFTAVTGAAHWEVLLRARAIETQCWIIAAAQCGEHPGGRQTWGHSMVVDPWGNIVSQAGSEKQLLLADIDTSMQEKIRKKMPVVNHSRFVKQLNSDKKSQI